MQLSEIVSPLYCIPPTLALICRQAAAEGLIKQKPISQRSSEARCGTVARLSQTAQLHTVSHVMLPLSHEHYIDI